MTIFEYIISIGIFCLSFYILYKKWHHASPRYLTDLPFVLALTYIILIYDRMDSILGLSGIMPITSLSRLLNIIAFAIALGINLLIMLTIWIPKRKKLRVVFMVAWLAVWIPLIIIFMSTIGNPDTLHSLLLVMSFPTIILLAVTWYFCYFQKRLSVINPLLVGIGMTGVIIGILLRVYFSIIGNPIGYVFTDLHWIAILVDIVSYTVMLVGFSREMSYS
jgi:hypothetical protein